GRLRPDRDRRGTPGDPWTTDARFHRRPAGPAFAGAGAGGAPAYARPLPAHGGGQRLVGILEVRFPGRGGPVPGCRHRRPAWLRRADGRPGGHRPRCAAGRGARGGARRRAGLHRGLRAAWRRQQGGPGGGAPGSGVAVAAVCQPVPGRPRGGVLARAQRGVRRAAGPRGAAPGRGVAGRHPDRARSARAGTLKPGRIVDAAGRVVRDAAPGGRDQATAARIASGSGALRPVWVSIQTTTTLPSEYSTFSSFWSRMRWPMVTLLLPRRSTNSSTTMSLGHTIDAR